SPAAGVLAEILVHEGETVGVGTVVAYVETDPENATIGESGEVAGTAAASGASDAAPPAQSAAPAAVADPSAPAIVAGREGGATGAPPASLPLPEHPRGNGGIESEEERLRRRSTPLVRRIAQEHGVRLDAVQGSGRAGRVTKEDILKY